MAEPRLATVPDRYLSGVALAALVPGAAAAVAGALARWPQLLTAPQLAFSSDQVLGELWPAAAVLAAAPLLWWLGDRRRVAGRGRALPVAGSRQAMGWDSQQQRAHRYGAPAIVTGLLLFVITVTLDWAVGRTQFDGMPPAYHDEYSYLFQAKTFLAGRLYFPPHRLASFFDQMHVLNDGGVFASRFFPGVGLWLAPWVALGCPYWGQYVASGLTAVLVFGLGRELMHDSAVRLGLWGRGSRSAAWALGVCLALYCLGSPATVILGAADGPRPVVTVGGLLLAVAAAVMTVLLVGVRSRGGAAEAGGGPLPDVAALAAALLWISSPAQVLFANLLLSHPPAMLGLAAFAFSYLRAVGGRGLGWCLVGGLSLAFAMLCRPLTAFGFALSFGIFTAVLIVRGRLAGWKRRLSVALTPVLAGLALLAGYNAALTGSPLRSPYGLYTSIYTPRHVYGFYNVSRGARHAGPKVLNSYDAWAQELTPTRACRLLGVRALAGAGWSCGALVVAWALLVSLFTQTWAASVWWLALGAVAGLHAAYFPFAFEGIFGLSYVFESVAVLCVIVAGVSALLLASWCRGGRWGRVMWIGLLLLAGTVDAGAELRRGVTEVRFARGYYQRFERELRQAGVRPPALVFIEPDRSQVHLDLVVNSPTLDDPILRVRNRGEENRELVRAMPGRAVWLYDARTHRLYRYRREQPSP